MTHIKLFDFDGVLGSPFEEALFCLPTTLQDPGFVHKAALKYGLKLGGESEKSARYMAMQAVMTDLGHNIKTGPMFDKATGDLMIITARSDFYAVQRMMDFLNWHNIIPTKMMTVNNLPKGLMISNILENNQTASFTFWDDNPKHIRSAQDLQSERLSVIHVDNDMEPMYEKAHKYYRDHLIRHLE